jgi:sugar O-acyltransferase (sialic acid O-acetyltransferase NeuD family)
VVIGAGGHARVLLDALHAAGGDVEYVLIDADASRIGSSVDGIPVVGTDESLDALVSAGAAAFVVGVGGNGNNRIRKRIFDRAIAAGLRPLSVIHPASIRSPHATVESGSQLLAGSIVNPGSVVGVNAIINTGSVVDHDCSVGAHAHVATGARLAGGVHLGEGVHVGAGATILPGVRVGEWTVVGAGGVVVRDVPDHLVIAGVPARVLRRLELQEGT